jgi:hypothetical protein
VIYVITVGFIARGKLRNQNGVKIEVEVIKLRFVRLKPELLESGEMERILLKVRERFVDSFE